MKTIVRRNFDSNQKSLDGEVVSFEKTIGNDAILAVVTNPDQVQVKVDGNIEGESPLNINLTSGTHQLEVSEKGYNSINFPTNLVGGYKLTAVIDLSATPSKPTQEEKKQDLNQAMVTILSTPNGFLRVRSEPDIASSEIGQVHEGEKYELIKKDDKSGWYDIALTASVSGWVSNTYTVLK